MLRGEVPGEAERRPHVHVERLLPVVERVVDERVASQDAGGVHEYVVRAERVDSAEALVRPHIRGNPGRAREAGERLAERRFRDVDAEYLITVVREPPGNRAPDPRACARNHRPPRGHRAVYPPSAKSIAPVT